MLTAPPQGDVPAQQQWHGDDSAALQGAARAEEPSQLHPPVIVGRLSTVVKNRRLAAMQRLQQEGFFSDEQMRRRAPLLYSQLVGQYLGESHPLHPASQVVAPASAPGSPDGSQPKNQGGQGAGGAAAAAGRKFSTFLMQQHDELEVRLRMAQEQAEEDAQRSEHDSDEEDDDSNEHEGSGHASADDSSDEECQLRAARRQAEQIKRAPVKPGQQQRSASFLLERHRELKQEMEYRFLSGEEGAWVNYAEIDSDATGHLDEHWAREEARDAEDAYFKESDDEEQDKKEGMEMDYDY